ncbi:uncharacterized protein B0H18DRAFT_1126507 [Fomitopsis serialis]|uniref:uncharacterized protein n=1 Tax=Fomitopsis serialis TaxID=139415 RepID=UPI0020072E6A|nr:uncharacterized protein B0H18DRAFT_1126507 [Neoantrodia serialis]KAH9913187.1 hypothetical protein B0H18DRAFT_1126507 [Neoantrodia serialis]
MARITTSDQEDDKARPLEVRAEGSTKWETYAGSADVDDDSFSGSNSIDASDASDGEYCSQEGNSQFEGDDMDDIDQLQSTTDDEQSSDINIEERHHDERLGDHSSSSTANPPTRRVHMEDTKEGAQVVKRVRTHSTETGPRHKKPRKDTIPSQAIAFPGVVKSNVGLVPGAASQRLSGVVDNQYNAHDVAEAQALMGNINIQSSVCNSFRAVLQAAEIALATAKEKERRIEEDLLKLETQLRMLQRTK